MRRDGSVSRVAAHCRRFPGAAGDVVRDAHRVKGQAVVAVGLPQRLLGAVQRLHIRPEFVLRGTGAVVPPVPRQEPFAAVAAGEIADDPFGKFRVFHHHIHQGAHQRLGVLEVFVRGHRSVAHALPVLIDEHVVIGAAEDGGIRFPRAEIQDQIRILAQLGNVVDDPVKLLRGSGGVALVDIQVHAENLHPMFPGKLGLANRRTVGRIRRRQTAARINNRLDLPAVYGKPGDAAHLHQSRFHHMFILSREIGILIPSGRREGISPASRHGQQPGDGPAALRPRAASRKSCPLRSYQPSCQPMPQPCRSACFP